MAASLEMILRQPKRVVAHGFRAARLLLERARIASVELPWRGPQVHANDYALRTRLGCPRKSDPTSV